MPLAIERVIKVVFYWLMFLVTIFAIVVGICLGNDGAWTVGLVPIVISPLMMAVWRLVLEPTMTVSQMFNPHTQSWAFLFGDLIFLPIALGAAAVASKNGGGGFFTSRGWIVISISFGTFLAVAYRFVVNTPGYSGADASRMMSPTSLWHDIVVYTVCATLLVYLGIPALSTDFTGAGKIALLAFIVWCVLGILDATVHRPAPENLHPLKEETYLSSI